MIDSKISEMFSTARIYCLVSIVCAHMYFPNTVAWMVLSRLGTVGVVLFLITSGYFYVPEKFGSFSKLLKKKAISICVPWFFLGSLAWLYNAIVSTQYRSTIGYLKWILGNGTYLYYMPILLICFILFYKAPKAVLIASLPINAVSVIITAHGIADPIIFSMGINHYLNIFNWIGFFALGMLLRQIDPEKLYSYLKKFGIAGGALFVLFFWVLLVFGNLRFDYFSFVAMPYELAGSVAILSLSTFSLTKYKILRKLSGYAFAIYLIHMVFIGLLDSILAKSIVTMFMAPIIIITIVFLLFYCGEYLSHVLKMDKLYVLLVGKREDK